MPVISTSDFKSYRQITGTDAARDARIQTLIDAVQARAERYLDRRFDSGATTETYDFNIKGVYFLKKTPVASITSVILLDMQNNESTIASNMYKFNADTGEIHIYADRTTGGLWWDMGLDDFDVTENHWQFQAVRIAYTGGYTVYPSDLKLAFLQMTDDLYTKNAQGQGVNHQLTGGELGEIKYTMKSEEEMRLLERRYLVPFRQGGVL